ncbi:cell elongation-specific peptidoglycan biosynthesis regulator RodA [Stella humosa]|uniref:Peptidoglycan glycosyltransferase MrdB n=1 Tax=Stella humosa TaxID=94 RepID=A0A3N1LHJ3_9PROT|nr:rod shape-determining protein RodA [Stella humosa]ROP90720.1 cell elongation-specific peptidoglycan biosynthesis regulator RodA [Stella humosa]BBK29380.1 rod shape-determining protein RodA [Stella humosa]
MSMLDRQPRATAPLLLDRIWQINWLLVLLLSAIAGVGFAMLYSAAGGSFQPWAEKQMLRFAFGLTGMILVALVDLRIWLRLAYVIYGLALVLLIGVEIRGEIGMGAQRWIDFGFIQLQPSEIMKIALVLALARYFHGLDMDEIGRPLMLLVPIALVFAPAVLVLKQPDLGTAIMLIAGGGAMFFIAGVRLWKFAAVLAFAAATLPIAWELLRDYQKKRVYTFLNPEADPLGAGYHIIQSKIALGSGGLFGKGYLQGSQTHLNFLPEKQTDFIFTMLAEEWGLVGGLALLGLYALVILYGFLIALRSRNQFGRLLALGVTSTLFLYAFINSGMVMGLMPVVGVPLALVSFGGTAMLTVLFGMGLVMGVYVHRDLELNRQGEVGTD